MVLHGTVGNSLQCVIVVFPDHTHLLFGLDTVRIDLTTFSLGDDNKTLCVVVGEKEIKITFKKREGRNIISLGSLSSTIGKRGSAVIRDLLHVNLLEYTAEKKLI